MNADTRDQDSTAANAWLPTLALAYLVFVVYGSLVPLEVRHLDLASAWQAFLAVPYLALDMDDRQDWIANGVLYLPLGLLLSATLSTAGTGRRSRLAGALLAMPVCLLIATGVEFTQVFFANRSVSMNDLLAEALGSLAGGLVWMAWGRTLVDVASRVASGSRAAIGAGIVVYVVGFVLLSLFPFDFLVSMEELRWKLEQHPPRLLSVADDCASALHCTVRLPLQWLAMLPLGMLLGLRAAGEGRRWRLPNLLGIGFALGLLVELLEFVTVSGRSHGDSVLVTALGVPCGYFGARWLVSGRGLPQAVGPRRVLLLLAAPVYLLALAWVNRLQFQAPASLDAVLETLAATRLVPFYYHYYSPELAALVSVVAAVAMYFPVGALVWAWRGRDTVSAPSQAMAASFWLATLLATMVWVGRLFLADYRFADPTNILLAGLAAMTGLGTTRIAARWIAAASENATDEPPPAAPLTRGVHLRRDSLLGFLAVGLLIVLLATHPLAQVVTPVCLLYAALLFTFPSAWLILVPLAVPVFDLGAWTGRTLVEEIDLVVLATVAVLAIRRDRLQQAQPLSWIARVIVALVAISYLLSLVKGLLPLAPLDADALADPLNPWNSLRIARMLLLPLLLLPFLREALARDETAADKLATGMLLGLVATGASVLWERYTFAGIADLSIQFRVAGLFSGMHVGGQQIDSYLAAALPFVAWFAVRRASWSARLLATVAGVLGLYVVVMSFTRWTYLMTVASALLLFAAMVVSSRNAGRLQRRNVVAAMVVAAVGFLVLGVVSLSDTYMRERLAWLEADAEGRTDHWSVLVAMMGRDRHNALLGAGLGAFPRAWRQERPIDEQTARALHRREANNGLLSLQSGTPLYLEQRVLLTDEKSYRLVVRVRAASNPAGLQLALCEKTVMYSRECAHAYFDVKGDDSWHTHEVLLPVDDVGGSLPGLPGWVRRPVYLALFLPSDSDPVDIDSISLRDAGGRELLRNGDFSAGRDHWRFTSDNHIVWHVKNMALLLVFEQGWLGLLAVVALSVLVVGRQAAGLGKGRPEAAILLTAYFGMWFIGATGSVLDSTRIGMLFYLLAFWSIAHPWRRADAGVP